MFVSSRYFDKSVQFIDMADEDFFLECLNQAISLVDKVAVLAKDNIKSATPICHISKLSKQTDTETNVDRIYLHTDRARRGFIMGDVDYEADEVEQSEAMRQSLIDFATKYNTPLMIYPTMSYPEKPRFRWILLTKRVMDPVAYHKAVKFVYDSIRFECTDKSDFNMKVNRNLPFFNNKAQVDGIYCTFGDKALEKLNNSLWKDIEVPKPKVRNFDTPIKYKLHDIKLDPAKFLEACEVIAQDPMCRGYKGFWCLTAAIAASVLCGGLDETTARYGMGVLAQAAEDSITKARWERENQGFLTEQMMQIAKTMELEKVKPLVTYREFVKAQA